MCFVALLTLISPRLALFAVWLFSDLLSRAYDDWIVPSSASSCCPGRRSPTRSCGAPGPNGVEGFEWFIVILAFVFDLGSYASSSRQRERY